ncbi:MAG TPA: CoA ester lyase [Gammaproteobacteria bacterium]|nr:CoA ester lyase [Gammaproteobacteria bacterium]
MGLYRSMLFAPGNHSPKVEKSLTLDADVVILDLEDAVAVTEKPATRPLVVEALQKPRSCLGYVRVNAFDTPFCYGDLQAVVQRGVDGIMLPKVESAVHLQCIDWLMTQLERERELEEGAIDLLPIIETGKGVSSLKSICAASSRVKRLSFGAGDYSLDMNMRWTRGEREMGHARAAIAVESRAADLEPPVDTVFIHLGDIEALKGSTELAREMGYQGKLCIHPEQVPVINAVFTPGEEEIAKAKRYVEAFEEAEASGSASIQVGGYFIDYPIVEKARRVLAIASEIEARKSN